MKKVLTMGPYIYDDDRSLWYCKGNDVVEGVVRVIDKELCYAIIEKYERPDFDVARQSYSEYRTYWYPVGLEIDK